MVPKLVLHRKPAIFSFIYWDPMVSTVLSEIHFCPPKREILRETHTYTHPSFTPLSKAKSPLVPKKEALYKKGRGEKKSHPPFCIFLTNGSCLSHCFSHSRPQRCCSIQNLPRNATWDLPHTQCGINELIHTALSSSNVSAAWPNVNKP